MSEAKTAPRRMSTKHPGVTYRTRANGERRYYIDYVDTSGKRVWKAVPGKMEDARRERAAILDRMGKGEKVVHSRMTVEALASSYLDTQTGHLRPVTLTNYEYNLNHWVVPFLGQRRVTELGTADIVAFINHMREKGYKRWTIQSCLTPMGTMFRYAVRQGWMARNPIQDLHRSERPKTDQAQMRILSTDEIQQLLAAASSTYRTVYATAIFTGLRVGELLRLTWDDVDLANATIQVRESKTDAGVREVVIPDFLVRMLAAHPTTEGFVFQTKRRGAMDRRVVGRGLRRTLVKAGIPHLRFHDLRHTYASILVSEGLDVVYISKQMGHANPAITLKLYAKLFDAEKRKSETRDKLEARFAGVVE